MRKKLKITLIIMGVILISLIGTIVLFILAIHFFFSNSCGNEVLSTNNSPDGTYSAYVFTRDCGATTSDSYQLSILKKDKNLKNNVGNTFVSEEIFDLEWLDDGQLLVVYPTSAKNYKMKNKIGRVDIVYPSE